MTFHFKNQNSRLNNLPDELIIYVYDFLKDDTKYKTFVKNLITYHAIYNHIREITKLRIYIKFNDDNSTLKVSLKDPLNKDFETTLYYFIDNDGLYIDYNYYSIIPTDENNIILVAYDPED
jgi:hypothetical protein